MSCARNRFLLYTAQHSTTMAAVEGDVKAPAPVVLYPSPGMGHLVSMVELGKLFVLRGLPVTVVTVDPPYNTGATAAFIARASAANPSISFRRLPPVDVPQGSSPHHEALAFELLRLCNGNLLEFLRAVTPRALVVDFFCGPAFDAAAELGVPCYVFFTSGANVLAAFFHFPVIDAAGTKSFRELGYQPLLIPGLPPLPANHMPLPMLDRDDDAYRGFLRKSIRLPEAHGIIINTFDVLEPRALKAMTAGRCTPDGQRTPPLYSIGPLIMSKGKENGNNRDECLGWLDDQPQASVVFLSFGSIGLFSGEQLTEMAIGLERSGQRFMWVVRSPPSNDPEKQFERPPEPDLEALMPEGFLERTAGRGLVVKSWAPQVEVLKHKAVGGFVTHCGWNSVLEAIMAGVPMVAWPLYAEQWMNKVFLTEEMLLAVAVEGYDKELVTASEVEKKVRWLMESEGGKEMRARTVAMKESAEEALRAGGSSHAALRKLVEEWNTTENPE